MELGIPNTTNAIDGHFADLKTKLRNHNGLTLKRKKKFIEGFLSKLFQVIISPALFIHYIALS